MHKRRDRSRAATISPGPYIESPHIEELRLIAETHDLSSLRQLQMRINAEGESARIALRTEIDELQAIVRELDAVALLGALHVWDARGRLVLSAAQTHGFDAMIEFFAGLVTSQPEEQLVKYIGTPFDPQLVLDVENKLRTIANHQMAIDFAENLSHSSQSRIDNAIGLLKLERHFDRMAGFDPHLRRIAGGIFGLIDNQVEAEVGFKLTDSIRFADAYARRLIDYSRSAQEWVESVHPAFSGDSDDETRLQWMCTEMLMSCLSTAAPIELEIDTELSATIGISHESFSRLVSAMATPLGSQQIDDLHGENTIRYKPIIQLSTGEWIWHRPGDFLHGALEWAFEVASASESLRASFDQARQTVAERLPADVLAPIFGDRVHRNVKFPGAESPGEMDALIRLPGAYLVAECKGGRFTLPARRGAIGRVETHAKQIVTKGADQNQRAVQAIRNEHPLTDSSRRIVSVGGNDIGLTLIVTLDRIDPFNTHLGSPADENLDDRSWIIALADLLLIVEILPTPSEFFAYAMKRVEMVRTDAYRVIVEADALGAWCEDRFASFDPVAPNAFTLIDKTSDSINDYFAFAVVSDFSDFPEMQEGHLPPRPTSGVPTVVLDALARLFSANSPRWPTLCRLAFDVEPSEWRKLGPILEMVRAPHRVRGRYARKRLEQAQRGFLFARVLPLRVITSPAESADVADYLDVWP